MIRLALTFVLFSTAAMAQQAIQGVSADLRVLDKVTGAVTDLSMSIGETQQVGPLRVNLQECRAPLANPTGDAYALLIINYRDSAAPVFQGWMIASAPALNAMDHPRYDVWVLRCNN